MWILYLRPGVNICQRKQMTSRKQLKQNSGSTEKLGLLPKLYVNLEHLNPNI
jgi:hypothetical protein